MSNNGSFSSTKAYGSKEEIQERPETPEVQKTIYADIYHRPQPVPCECITLLNRKCFFGKMNIIGHRFVIDNYKAKAKDELTVQINEVLIALEMSPDEEWTFVLGTRYSSVQDKLGHVPSKILSPEYKKK